MREPLSERGGIEASLEKGPESGFKELVGGSLGAAPDSLRGPHCELFRLYRA